MDSVHIYYKVYRLRADVCTAGLNKKRQETKNLEETGINKNVGLFSRKKTKQANEIKCSFWRFIRSICQTMPQKSLFVDLIPSSTRGTSGSPNLMRSATSVNQRGWGRLSLRNWNGSPCQIKACEVEGRVFDCR